MIRSDDELPKVFEAHSQTGEPARVRLHTNRRLLPAVVIDEPDPDDAGDFRGQIILRVVIDRGNRQRVRIHGNGHEQSVRGVCLLERRRMREIFGQVAERRIDGRLHVNSGRIDAPREFELHIDRTGTERTRRNDGKDTR